MTDIQPGDEIWIGPVGPIHVRDEHDPEWVVEQAAWREPRARAYAMVTVDDHLVGLKDPDWRCRFEVIDRLIARGRTDPRTLPALLDAVKSDASWEVRDYIAFRLGDFPAEAVEGALRLAEKDPHPEVRRSARDSLAQLGLPAASDPAPFPNRIDTTA